MTTAERKEAILLLDDGTIYRGNLIVSCPEASGEICFNTGMTGYQEVFTDPSYAGQIAVTTHVHIGNYGIHADEFESDKIQISGLVCHSFSDFFSRDTAESTLLELFQKQGIPVIEGIDTRALVRHIRSKGAMNALISSDLENIDMLKQRLAKAPSMKGMELSSKVSVTSAYTLGLDSAKFRVAVLDLGVKKQILHCLVDRGCYVKIFPAKTSFAEMELFQPDGYMLSNGPGDPDTMGYAVDTMKEILKAGRPYFGICMGHQVFAKALGISTFKMFNGHRGVNHPVLNLRTGKGEITSQNHGFAISASDLENHPDAEISHIHLNDQTVSGIRLKNGRAFSVQFHPESSPGPHDSRYLFDDFIDLMEVEVQNSKKAGYLAR